jgi:hypothetical protein
VRTTLDIADDVLLAVKDLALRERRSAGEVISDLARQALQDRQDADEVAKTGGSYGFEPLPHRGSAVSNELIDRLREESE